MKINFASKTIEITKTFADKASHFGSEEYHALRTAMCDLPDFEVAIKVTAKPRRTYMKGLSYIAIPGMKQDCHDNLPSELLLSWTPEQMDYMHDVSYWRNMVSQSRYAEIIEVSEMASNEEVWKDWLAQENEYAVGDRKSMDAGGGKYLNFIKIVLKKK